MMKLFAAVVMVGLVSSHESDGERWVKHSTNEWWFYSASVSAAPCGKVFKVHEAYMALDGDDVLIETEADYGDEFSHPLGSAKVWAENSRQCREERLNRCTNRICD